MSSDMIYTAKNGSHKIRGAKRREALLTDLMGDGAGVTLKEKSRIGIHGLNRNNNTELVSLNITSISNVYITFGILLPLIIHFTSKYSP